MSYGVVRVSQRQKERGQAYRPLRPLSQGFIPPPTAIMQIPGTRLLSSTYTNYDGRRNRGYRGTISLFGAFWVQRNIAWVQTFEWKFYFVQRLRLMNPENVTGASRIETKNVSTRSTAALSCNPLPHNVDAVAACQYTVVYVFKNS